MINSAIIENKQKRIIGNIINDIYLLPSWEILQSFSVYEKKFLFFKKPLKVNLLHKFSSKNMVEKFSVNTIEGKNIANMDLKIYKDSVYIVSLEITEGLNISGAIEKLIDTAIEKAIKNTTKKEVSINLFKKGKIKRILKNKGFKTIKNQSVYEKHMLGETYQYNRSV